MKKTQSICGNNVSKFAIFARKYLCFVIIKTLLALGGKGEGGGGRGGAEWEF